MEDISQVDSDRILAQCQQHPLMLVIRQYLTEIQRISESTAIEALAMRGDVDLAKREAVAAVCVENILQWLDRKEQ